MEFESIISGRGGWSSDVSCCQRALRPADPCRFIKTKILAPVVIEKLTEAGYEFAEVEDAAKALMKIASDSSINGR
jgi:hypothetical protein